MTGDEAAATAVTPTQDAQCLLATSRADVSTAAMADNNEEVEVTDAAERHLSPQGFERRLAFEHGNALGLKAQPPQRTRLLATTGNFPDDVVFAHTSV